MTDVQTKVVIYRAPAYQAVQYQYHKRRSRRVRERMKKEAQCESYEVDAGTAETLGPSDRSDWASSAWGHQD